MHINDKEIIVTLATTALFALTGITSAAAEVSISGNVRFHYEAWSDGSADTNGNNNNRMTSSSEFNFASETVTESGLKISPFARIDASGAVTKQYIEFSDDWGTLTLGKQTSPAQSFSLGANERGTVAGADKAAGGNVTAGGPTINGGSGIALSDAIQPKVIFVAPSVNNLNIAVSVTDAGAASSANVTEYGAQYSLPEFWGISSTLGYASAAKSNSGKPASDKASASEIALAADYGAFSASLVRISRDADQGASKKSESANEFEVVYSASESLKVNAILFSGEGTNGAVDGDKLSSNGFGVKYTIAPGLYGSLGWNSYEYKDASAGETFDGSAYKIRVHADF